MQGLFDSTTDEQTTAQADLQLSDTIEAPAETETALKTETMGDTSATEDTTPAFRKVSLKVNDADYELDLPDEIADIAKNGLLMQADYTKGKQQLSEKEKALQARESEIDSSLNDMRQVIEFEAAQMDSPEMVELKEYDPEEYAKRYNAIQDKIQKYNGYLNGRREQHEARYNETVQAEMSKYTEVVPEWLDESVKKSDFADMGKYLEDNGFTQDEINGMYPAKAMKAIRQAMLYDKTLKSAQSKKKTEAPKSTAPGSANKEKASQSLYDLFAAQMKQ
jgi:hypothetical protein